MENIMNNLDIEESENIIQDIIKFELSPASRKYLMVALAKIQGLENLSKAILPYHNPNEQKLADLRAENRILQYKIKLAK